VQEDPEIARGRAKRAAERAAQRAALAEATRGDSHDPEKQGYYAAACTRAGLLGSGEALFFFVFFSWVAIVLLLVVVTHLLPQDETSPVLKLNDPLHYWGVRLWPVFPGALVFGLLVFTIARSGRASAARRETAWREALPFPISGHLDAFGHGSWESELTVELWFAGDLPKAELQRLLDLFSPNARVKVYDDSLSFKVPHGGRTGAVSNVVFSSTSGSNVMPAKEHISNRALLLLFHDLVAEVLLPLHAGTPIEAVKLG
jgi:hypothetical protein